MNKKGFALWEILVSCICLTFFVGLTFYALQAFAAYKLRTDFYMLKSLIIHTHYKALMTGIDQKIIFNEQTHTYAYDGMVRHLSSGIEFSVVPHIMGPPSNPITMIKKPISFEHNTLVCYAKGGVSAGALYIQDTITRTMYACTVNVAHVFNIRFYRYEKNRWVLIA